MIRSGQAYVAALTVVAALATPQCARYAVVRPPGRASQAPAVAEVSSAMIRESGWSRPRRLPVSDGGWEDSTYITRDGRYILFFYHPAQDRVTNPRRAMQVQFDGRIYASERPFDTKQLHRVSSPDLVSDAGPYVAANGAFYYHRTVPFKGSSRIVRDGAELKLGTAGHESNPHYCDALDELYFDNGDEDILVYRDGRSTPLPPPINVAGSRDFQPFLSDDCQTMFFTSTRGGGSLGEIYRSTRQGASGWSQPQLFISDPVGVGEFSMTSDGRQLVFTQVVQIVGGITTDIYHSSR